MHANLTTYFTGAYLFIKMKLLRRAWKSLKVLTCPYPSQSKLIQIEAFKWCATVPCNSKSSKVVLRQPATAQPLDLVLHLKALICICKGLDDQSNASTFKICQAILKGVILLHKYNLVFQWHTTVPAYFKQQKNRGMLTQEKISRYLKSAYSLSFLANQNYLELLKDM